MDDMGTVILHQHLDGFCGFFCIIKKKRSIHQAPNSDTIIMCQGLNSPCFPMVWDGHQPNNRKIYTHYKDSLWQVGWQFLIKRVLTLAHISSRISIWAMKRRLGVSLVVNGLLGMKSCCYVGFSSNRPWNGNPVKNQDSIQGTRMSRWKLESIILIVSDWTGPLVCVTYTQALGRTNPSAVYAPETVQSNEGRGALGPSSLHVWW